MRALRSGARGRRPADTLGGVSAGTRLTFRAEVMPGRGGDERTFTVGRVLAGGRVELIGMGGQHAVAEFESLES